MCCCHEKSMSKCSNKNDKSSSSSRSKNTDTLSTGNTQIRTIKINIKISGFILIHICMLTHLASTGIIEYGSSSKTINEPFKFFIGGIPQNITNKVIQILWFYLIYVNFFSYFSLIYSNIIN